MEIIVTRDYDKMSDLASVIFIQAIKENPNITLGLATGSSPIGLYRRLVKAYEEGQISFKDVTTFNLDEYIGVDPENETSYAYFMNKHLFNHIDIDKNNAHLPNGVMSEKEKSCKEYDHKIRNSGGIDLQLLGVGNDGHIAFNEPGEYLPVNTHIAKLSESTREANSRFFAPPNEVPKKAISMGMGQILKSKKIVLLASGEQKREALQCLFEGDKVDTFNPVSFLLLHPDVTVIIDEDAHNG